MSEPEMESLRTMGESNGDCAWAVAEIERLRKIETAARNLQDTTIPFPVALEQLDAVLAPPVQEKP